MTEKRAEKSSLRFVEFTSDDVTRLADFNAQIRAQMADPEAFYAHDVAYYRRMTGAGGWTFGFEDAEGIACAYSFEIDLEPYRENWLFPTEALLLKVPAAWAGSFAIARRHRKSGLREMLHKSVVAMLNVYGVEATVGGAAPQNFKYRLPGVQKEDKKVVGIYYDETGWNHLSTGTAGSCNTDHLPEAVEVWVRSDDEARYRQAIEDLMVGITAREVEDGCEIGFGKIRS